MDSKYRFHQNTKTAKILANLIEKIIKYAKILAYGRTSITICNI